MTNLLMFDFRFVTPRGSSGMYKRFGEIYRLHLQCWRLQAPLSPHGLTTQKNLKSKYAIFCLFCSPSSIISATGCTSHSFRLTALPFVVYFAWSMYESSESIPDTEWRTLLVWVQNAVLYLKEFRILLLINIFETDVTVGNSFYHFS
jgi:hypothetical protein